MLNMAKSAKKALSLRRDGVFRLLVMMTAILSWVIATGTASVLGLENIYSQWQLTQKSKISVYLLADTPEKTVNNLSKSLKELSGVDGISRLSDDTIKNLIEPYFQGDASFPLPIVLDVTTTTNFDRARFDSRIQNHAPMAEIDDARQLLTSIAKAVRMAQSTALLLAGMMLAIMLMLVTLTVRAGLKSQQNTLHIMQYVGATDDFLSKLITRQILGRSLFGWALGTGFALLTTALASWAWPVLWAYVTPSVWVGFICAPLVLPLGAFVAAQFTASSVISQKI